MQFQGGEWRDVPQVKEAKPAAALPEKKMVVVLPFIEKEMEQVISFLKRSNQLCGVIPRTIYLLPFKGIDTTEVRKVAETAFEKVGFILDSEGVTSDWQGRELMRCASGPNSLFRQATWHCYLKKIGPWLWLEPDCWPMTDRWFYDLEQEYMSAAKPFLGVKMRTSDGKEYLNGVGIYPWNAVQYAPLLVQASTWTQHPEYEVGFDIAGGKDVLSKAHITRKIQLVSHLARGNVDVRPDVVLCHGRIDLSSGNATDVCAPSTVNGQPEGVQPATQKPFLDGHGIQGEPEAEVFGDASPHAAPCVPSHETPVQEIPIGGIGLHGIKCTCPEKDFPCPFHFRDNETPVQESFPQSRQDGGEYGGISKEIRQAVEDLVGLWDRQPHRKVLIVKELRKAKLVPKHFR